MLSRSTKGNVREDRFAQSLIAVSSGSTNSKAGAADTLHCSYLKSHFTEYW